MLPEVGIVKSSTNYNNNNNNHIFTMSQPQKQQNQPQLKLTYFDFAGRGEIARLALVQGGIAFDDDRVTGEQFAARKASLPLGQVPVLEVDGTTYSQSLALARYGAKLGGLYPTDALEALRVDMVLETIKDLTPTMIDIVFYIKDESVKADKTKQLLTETLPRSLRALENLVTGRYFVGDRITLADVYLFDQVHNWITPNFASADLSSYPKLRSIVADVKAQPNIAAYLAKRA